MNQDWIQRDQRVIWHPYSPQKYAVPPIPIQKGDGVHLVDFNGKKYIDAISSWWVTLHGHAHPFINSRISQQAALLEQVIFAGFTHEPAISLAEALLNRLPSEFSKIFYSDNGSTATEVALKMALQFWSNQDIRHRKTILALRNAYHGDTFGAMSMSERGVFTYAFQDKLFDVRFIDPPTPSHPYPNDIDWDTVACLIYEPLVQGAGGMIMYEPEGLELLLQQCRQKEIITIADEVMTGFFRTGRFLASDYCTSKPDIICLSKGLTGGVLPMGITACSARIHAQFVTDDRTKTFFHGHSFTANPLACAAAIASLELLFRPECIDQVRMIEHEHRLFLQQLRQLGDQGKLVHPRMRGTILAFDVPQGNMNYLNTVNTERVKKALDQGVVLRPLGNTLYILPPYCIKREELHQVYSVILSLL